jgi:DNA-binding MarR family transcriptional regulator
MKVLVIETVLALTLIQVENLIVELKTEDKIDLQIPRVWGVLQELSPEEKQALKIMSKQTSFSLSNLAKALKISTATAHRLSKRLERIGAITSKKIGKERIMELTHMGKILATIEEEI